MSESRSLGPGHVDQIVLEAVLSLVHRRVGADVCFLWRLGRFLSFISLIFSLESGAIFLEISLMVTVVMVVTVEL